MYSWGLLMHNFTHFLEIQIVLNTEPGQRGCHCGFSVLLEVETLHWARGLGGRITTLYCQFLLFTLFMFYKVTTNTKVANIRGEIQC